jgi:hypothetical protein
MQGPSSRRQRAVQRGAWGNKYSPLDPSSCSARSRRRRRALQCGAAGVPAAATRKRTSPMGRYLPPGTSSAGRETMVIAARRPSGPCSSSRRCWSRIFTTSVPAPARASRGQLARGQAPHGLVSRSTRRSWSRIHHLRARPRTRLTLYAKGTPSLSTRLPRISLRGPSRPGPALLRVRSRVDTTNTRARGRAPEQVRARRAHCAHICDLLSTALLFARRDGRA